MGPWTPGMRVKGALALAEVDAPESVEALTAALSDPDLDVKAAAGLALASLRDPASIASLAAMVAGWDHPDLARARRAALHTLIAFRTQEAAVELARALATAHTAPLDLQERSALLAVAYAEQAGVAAPRVVRALVTLLAHEEHAVAERAMSLLMLSRRKATAHWPARCGRPRRRRPAAGSRKRSARAARTRQSRRS
jgi:HEAT repeat protein